MAHFVRRTEPPKLSDYRRYKRYLRIDFQHRCAYCEMSEAYRRGHESFGVDHFRPRRLFPALECVYTNLFYCCNECNSLKGVTWPSEGSAAAGYGFADPCDCDPYRTHLLEAPDGRLASITKTGEYTLRILRLNREACLRFRQRRARTAALIREYRRTLDIALMPEAIRSLFVQALEDIENEWKACYGEGTPW